MKFIFTRDTWQEIFGTIRKNKLRTAITVIGVFWGILLFIGLQGAAKGMENGFDTAFKGLATNSIFLWGQQTGIPYGGYNRNRNIQLELGDTYRTPIYFFRPESRQDYPPNLSILISGGKENNRDALSNGE